VGDAETRRPLVYATCTLTRSENRDLIAAFLRSTPDAVTVPAENWEGWPNFGEADDYGRQILPGEAGADGFYYAALNKSMNALRSNPKPNARRRPPPLAAFIGLCCTVFVAMLWTRPLQADGLEGRFEVRSADLQLKDGVYHLNAHVDLPVSDAVRRGLAEGVPLTMELDLDIERVRQLLPNSRVAELTQRYHLQYNAVSARYILRNDNSGQQQSLSTIEAAIEQLSEVRGCRCWTRP
jgi:hypothetical protein